MTANLRKACIMGHPVAQSRSPMIHNHWLKTLGLEGFYDKQDIEPGAFAGFVADLAGNGYVGGNVTVPHKEAALAACARLDDAARAIGAVNTLWLEDGLLCGGNSDAHGFIRNLDAVAPGWQRPGARALVLGAGGAARAALWSLVERGVEVDLVNRHVERAVELAQRFGSGTVPVRAHAWSAMGDLIGGADLLVNCTSLGMSGKPPLEIELSALPAHAVVYDIVYVPLETDLLREARARGNRGVDGLGMLLQQAGYGFSKWFGQRPEPDAELRRLIEADIRKA